MQYRWSTTLNIYLAYFYICVCVCIDTYLHVSISQTDKKIEKLLKQYGKI